MSTESRLSIESPYLRRRWPTPPCSVRPAMPVVETTPPGTASPKSCVSRSKSPQVAPPWARTVCVAGSTWTPRICERSMTRPPSLTALPATLWPPPLTESSRPCSRAKLTASTTSAAPRAPDDQRRAAVDQPVPDRARLVVALVARPQDAPPEPLRRTPRSPRRRASLRSSPSSSPLVSSRPMLTRTRSRGHWF